MYIHVRVSEFNWDPPHDQLPHLLNLNIGTG